MKIKKEAPELLDKVTGANNVMNRFDKDKETSLYIDILGEFLHGGTLTVKELNSAYKIKNASVIVQQLIDAGSVEKVPGSKTLEYQFKAGDGKGFFNE